MYHSHWRQLWVDLQIYPRSFFASGESHTTYIAGVTADQYNIVWEEEQMFMSDHWAWAYSELILRPGWVSVQSICCPIAGRFKGMGILKTYFGTAHTSSKSREIIDASKVISLSTFSRHWYCTWWPSWIWLESLILSTTAEMGWHT